MKVTRLEDVRGTPVAMEGAVNVCRQLPIGAGDGAPTFSFRVFTIGPDGHTPYHRHVTEHVNFVISGAGVLVDEAGEEHELSPGSFALVVPNEKHQFRSTSPDEPLVLICAVPREYE